MANNSICLPVKFGAGIGGLLRTCAVMTAPHRLNAWAGLLRAICSGQFPVEALRIGAADRAGRSLPPHPCPRQVRMPDRRPSGHAIRYMSGQCLSGDDQRQRFARVAVVSALTV
jgi:hypothetical protein